MQLVNFNAGVWEACMESVTPGPHLCDGDVWRESVKVCLELF